MWELDEADGYARSLKRFAKKHRRETLNALDNLDAYLSALNSGLKPQQIERGFLHHEPHGIKAFDESGPGAHKKATRLYAFPDEATETLHLITIGGKDEQPRDIDVCSQYVQDLLENREQADPQDRVSDTDDGE